MSKYSANGEDADIKDILESIWKMASDERNAIAVSGGRNGISGAVKARISDPAGPRSLGGTNGSRLRGSMVKRPLVDLRRTNGATSSLLASGQLLPFTKPIRHVRSTIKASSQAPQQSLSNGDPLVRSEAPLAAHPTPNGTHNPPPLEGASRQQDQSPGLKAVAPGTTVSNSRAAIGKPTAQPRRENEPKRVMAPFLDTRMNRMAGPEDMEQPGDANASPGPQASQAKAEAPKSVPSQPGLSSIDVSGQTPTAQITSTPGTQHTSADQSVVHESADASASAQRLPLGSAHDAAAEMLRPVLRQWLGENMPRIVETALQIEVAESIKKDSQDTGE